MRGISGVVVAALLVAVSIVAVLAFYLGIMPMLSPSTALMVHAQKLSVNYITQSGTEYQVATFDVRVANKASKQLTIKTIRIQVIYSNGDTGLAEVTYDQTNGWTATNTPAGMEVSVQGSGVLNPNQAQDLLVTIKQDTTSGQIRQVVFQIVAADPAGNTYTATSEAITVT